MHSYGIQSEKHRKASRSQIQNHLTALTMASVKPRTQVLIHSPRQATQTQFLIHAPRSLLTTASTAPATTTFSVAPSSSRKQYLIWPFPGKRYQFVTTNRTFALFAHAHGWVVQTANDFASGVRGPGRWNLFELHDYGIPIRQGIWDGPLVKYHIFMDVTKELRERYIRDTRLDPEAVQLRCATSCLPSIPEIELRQSMLEKEAERAWEKEQRRRREDLEERSRALENERCALQEESEGLERYKSFLKEQERDLETRLGSNSSPAPTENTERVETDGQDGGFQRFPQEHEKNNDEWDRNERPEERSVWKKLIGHVSGLFRWLRLAIKFTLLATWNSLGGRMSALPLWFWLVVWYALFIAMYVKAFGSSPHNEEHFKLIRL